ncbi:MAG: hypothetical protein ACI9FW_002035 [Flavobacterium sp.]|jgi:hypothetical protein
MNDMENNTEDNDMQQNDIINRSKDFTLLEMLDRVLNKGVIIAGDVVISVADVDLVYLGVKLMLSSVETMEKLKENKQ